MFSNKQRFLNVNDVAEYLGMSKDTIRAWTKQGHIPYYKFGRSVRFDMLQINAWIQEKGPITDSSESSNSDFPLRN